jgi:Cu(I)/Ag(I) efflux system membrane protein CusA/SilA
MVENAHKHLERWEETGKKEPRLQVISDAAKEVGEPLFFALLIITVSFMPIFALEAQEGRLFKPLAYTKTFSMFFASLLSITLIPALMGIFIKGKIQTETDNPVNRYLIKIYDPIIRHVLKHPLRTICTGLILFVLSMPVVWQLGSEFMPPLNEGTILYMPTSLPGIGISEASRLLQIQDKLIKKVPEVLSVFGKVGRAETPTDPAPMDMYETIINLKPKEKWRPGITWEKIIEELDNLVKIPGTVNAWIMPIKTRIDMLTTGVKTPVGIKIFGPDLKVIEKIGEKIEPLIKKVKGTRSVFAERAVSGYYLNINIDREKIARYGLKIEDVEMVIESALGGEELTTTVEGKERYTVNIRYLRELRDTPEKIGNIYIESPLGFQIPLNQVAEVKLDTGPMQIRDEDGSPVGFVYIDFANRDVGSYVEDAKKVIRKELKLPAGYGIEWTGQYEFLQRVSKRLTLIIPLTIFIIFFFHYVVFNSVVKSLMVMLSVPFALIGSFWFLLFYKFHFSIAVGVGLIALAGVAIETAIVMIVFLDEAYERYLKAGKLKTTKDLEEAVHEGAVQRVRPKLMTVCVGIAGLLPIMWSHGTGADVMQRIAAPMIGGLITSAILVLFIVPAIYFLWRKRELDNDSKG